MTINKPRVIKTMLAASLSLLQAYSFPNSLEDYFQKIRETCDQAWQKLCCDRVDSPKISKVMSRNKHSLGIEAFVHIVIISIYSKFGDIIWWDRVYCNSSIKDNEVQNKQEHYKVSNIKSTKHNTKCQETHAR